MQTLVSILFEPYLVLGLHIILEDATALDMWGTQKVNFLVILLISYALLAVSTTNCRNTEQFW